MTGQPMTLRTRTQKLMTAHPGISMIQMRKMRRKRSEELHRAIIGLRGGMTVLQEAEEGEEAEGAEVE